MIVDLLKYQAMTVYFPDGTRLMIKHNCGEYLVAHISPELEQIVNYFVSTEAPPEDDRPHDQTDG